MKWQGKKKLRLFFLELASNDEPDMQSDQDLLLAGQMLQGPLEIQKL